MLFGIKAIDSFRGFFLQPGMASGPELQSFLCSA